jgi:hypothetical protein
MRANGRIKPGWLMAGFRATLLRTNIPTFAAEKGVAVRSLGPARVQTANRELGRFWQHGCPIWVVSRLFLTNFVLHTHHRTYF